VKLRKKPTMKLRFAAIVSLVASVALVVAGCSSSAKKTTTSSSAAAGSSAASAVASPTGAAFKIGYICNCATGLGGGTTDLDTINAWEKYTNGHGGINGHPVQLFTQNEPGNPGVATNDVKTLVGDGIIALIDDDGASDQAWASYIASVNIPVFAVPFTSPAITLGTFAFSTGVSENYLGDEIILATKKVNATKLALLYCAEVAVCAYEINVLKAAAASYGGVDLVYDAAILQTAPDYAAQCLTAKEKGADAMFIASAGSVSIRVAQSCAQQGYTPHQVSDEAAWGASFPGKPGIDGFVGTSDNWPIFDTSLPAEQTMHTALNASSPAILASPNLTVGTELIWTLGLLITEAAVKGKVGSTNPMTPAALFDGVYADSGTTLGGLTPPLTFTKGQPNEDKCWFWVGINSGKFGTPYGTQPTCATTHPAAPASS
jgi:branched-chain amino acid transport system substrate-binding protein